MILQGALQNKNLLSPFSWPQSSPVMDVVYYELFIRSFHIHILSAERVNVASLNNVWQMLY